MENIVTKFNLTGECKISIKKVIQQWNKNCCVSQWRDEYTLCEQDTSADNFTKTSVKLRISKRQAHELIGKLDLFQFRSPVFASGSTWRNMDDEY